MKKASLWAFVLFLTGCASSTPEVRRLSPLWTPVPAPAQCRIITLIKASPAEVAGLSLDDTITSVNGKKPADASVVAELIAASPSAMSLEVQNSSGELRSLPIHLNDRPPRLGAVCDLSGWRKLGVTAAGNESLTTFNGPLALTASGIVDKGLIFLRVRVGNNSDHPISVTRAAFSATDGNGRPSLQMSPTQVMCFLYAEKGAHLLALKRRRNQSLDSNASAEAAAADESCAGVPTTGRVPEADNQQFADANAEYVAQESLWSTTVLPGAAADGLIYFPEPPALPLTLKVQIENVMFDVPLGLPQPRQVTVKESDLVRFFRAQKRGTALRLTLKKGKVFVGKFQSYDADNERVWFYESSSKSLLNSLSYPVSSIRAAEPLESVPAQRTVNPTVN